MSDDSQQEQFFEKHVRPLFVKHCLGCHGPKKQQASLRLDSAEFLRAGNENGPALVPGKPDESRIMDVLRYDEGDIQMPPAGKLTANELAVVEEWIRKGAFWPKSKAGSSDAEKSHDQNAWKKHWAFQSVERPELPKVMQSEWAKTPVDRFVLHRLEGQGLTPTNEADRATWLRRVTFDLIGLPPTYEEVQSFDADTSDAAFENVVDRLLSSPRYGERWGRHWLDVARYADTKGYVFREDRNYPESFTYRDWVIQALNSDMPFDRFVKLQLAADHFAKDAREELPAMGFLTLGRRFLNNRHDIIDDRIDVTTRGLMGLTVSCARCHDHKYDPIPTADYYSLYGVFASSQEPKNAPSPLRLVDADNPFNPYVYLRGSAGNRGPNVPRQFLMCLSPADRKPFTQGSGRKEMAEAIASPTNPLTARVIVNRIWGQYFGRYLVETPSDFGIRSDPPTHPRLLDWLASELMDNGWSLKHIHRQIALSSTYRQSSRSNAPKKADGTFASIDFDAENSLYWRMNRRRLDFEALRDSTLAASGYLSLQMGGPSVKIESPPFSHRRTVYSFIDRQNLPGLFRTFNFASPDTHAPKRYKTTVPQQGLFLLNSPFLSEQATGLAKRSQGENPEDVANRIRTLYQICFAREPSLEELALGETFLASASIEKIESQWEWGYGPIDPVTGKVTELTPFPHWTGKGWQGGLALPDPATGWAVLYADAGHPAKQFAVVRRWTATAEGQLRITGKLHHKNAQGDGVRASIVSHTGGSIANWTVHNSETQTALKSHAVQKGEVWDFIVDCRDNEQFDSFHWDVTLHLDTGASKQTISPRAEFGPGRLTAWEQYAQVLLLSNEFVFLD